MLERVRGGWTTLFWQPNSWWVHSDISTVCHPGQPAQGHHCPLLAKSWDLPSCCLLCATTQHVPPLGTGASSCYISPPFCPSQSPELLGTQRKMNISADENQSESFLKCHTFLSGFRKKTASLTDPAHLCFLTDLGRCDCLSLHQQPINKNPLWRCACKGNHFFYDQRTFLCSTIFFLSGWQKVWSISSCWQHPSPGSSKEERWGKEKYCLVIAAGWQGP